MDTRATRTRLGVVPVFIAVVFSTLMVAPAAMAPSTAVARAASTSGASDANLVDAGGLNVLKEADVDPINAGEVASFTITIWNTGPGDAFDVELHDDLPIGLAWDFDVVNDPDAGTGEAVDCSVASSLVSGGEEAWSLDCDLFTVEPSDAEDDTADEIAVRVFADTDPTDCGVLTNTAEVSASNQVETLGLEGPANVILSTATIDVRCETAPDPGPDSVAVVMTPPPLGGNPPLPNTATDIGLDGRPVTAPVELLVALFIGALCALALTNVKASNHRR